MDLLLSAFPYTNVYLIDLLLADCTEFNHYDFTDFSFNVWIDFVCENNKWNQSITETVRWS